LLVVMGLDGAVQLAVDAMQRALHGV
jgi:hypothetical protein